MNKQNAKRLLSKLVINVRSKHDCNKLSHELDNSFINWGIQNQISYLAQFSDLYMTDIINLTLKGHSIDYFNQRFGLNL